MLDLRTVTSIEALPMFDVSWPAELRTDWLDAAERLLLRPQPQRRRVPARPGSHWYPVTIEEVLSLAGERSPLLICGQCLCLRRHTFVRVQQPEQSHLWRCVECRAVRRWGNHDPALESWLIDSYL